MNDPFWLKVCKYHPSFGILTSHEILRMFCSYPEKAKIVVSLILFEVEQFWFLFNKQLIDRVCS